MKREVFDDGTASGEPKLPPHHEFRPDINGLRALAVLSVLAFHAGLPAPGGFAGVDIFFVISGYLISRIILSEREVKKFSLLGFYGKRVKRILPALLLTLAATWIMGWVVLAPDDFRRLGGHMEASSYFSVNLWLYRQSGGPAAYFNPDARYFPLLHLWSLSIEEQFYLVWPALLLGLFKLRRFLGAAIVVIFLASLVFCIVMTGKNSSGAFYFLSTRAWELALGAWLAQREVFSEPSPASMRLSNLRSGLGIALMLASVTFLSDEAPWPGYLALVPTVGCALVIASPGANIGRILLGNRLAQFFGLISYPLYLWHWPLLSIAHNYVGDHLPALLTALLLGLSVLLSWLTFAFLERPIASAYKKRPIVTAMLLLAGLGLAGLLGSYTRASGGIPQRFPPLVQTIFKFRESGGAPEARLRCGENRVQDVDTLEVARAKARAFYAERGCSKLDRPEQPTIVMLGDSHALHLLQGMETVYGDRANIVLLSSLGCAPLIAQTDWPRGIIGSTRCKAINEDVVRNIVALKPAAVIVGAYYVQFYEGVTRYFPSFLEDFDANVKALRRAGVNSPIVVMGQVPTWSPGVPYLVGREVLAEKGVSDFTRDHLNSDSLEAEARLAAHRWGENVIYISQFQALCGEKGCRRFVGPRVPEDMIAMDYGHYTPAGSNYAVKTILAPILDKILKDAAHPSAQ